jgi:hypothetical protein
MPYIPKNRRDDIDIGLQYPRTIGEVNYAITGVCNEWAKLRGRNYSTYNEIIGVLECAKLEFYRRAVAAYEDEKIKLNGDVYPT